MNKSKFLLALSSFLFLIILTVVFATSTTSAQTTVEYKYDDLEWCEPAGNNCIVITAPPKI